VYNKTATELNELFMSGKVSAEEIAKYFITRAQALDPKIQSLLSITEEKALTKARELDRKLKNKEPLAKKRLAHLSF
jgi:aspartyl-tRNA(Asn)/glutamyl-tRNA(Gln) amidotransferase subunit A